MRPASALPAPSTARHDPGVSQPEAESAFRYHPSPLQTGSAVEDEVQCSVCGVVRTVRYTGPLYGKQADALCLVCIRSGEASAALAVAGAPAEFTDVGWGVPPDVPRAVLEELAYRTPGFAGWQQEHWMYHCGDAAAYLGRAGCERLRLFPEALEMLLHENDEYGWTAEQSHEYVRQLHPDGDATAYVFRCLHCGTHLAYSDMS